MNSVIIQEDPNLEKKKNLWETTTPAPKQENTERNKNKFKNKEEK